VIHFPRHVNLFTDQGTDGVSWSLSLDF